VEVNRSEYIKGSRRPKIVNFVCEKCKGEFQFKEDVYSSSGLKRVKEGDRSYLKMVSHHICQKCEDKHVEDAIKKMQKCADQIMKKPKSEKPLDVSDEQV